MNDLTYADYFQGNVTAAKVTLVNRVTQVYESERAIRLVLVNNTDQTNLNTVARAVGLKGPCGSAACFTSDQLTACSASTLDRNRIVLGQLVGASNFDIGHVILGRDGGGIAGGGVVGGDEKARGCTGLAAPVGDCFAIDFVAHEIGHQFSADHTFTGTQEQCRQQPPRGELRRTGQWIVHFGYAGTCQQDNLQRRSDPYFSQRSYAQITTYILAVQPNISEVQTASLRDFTTNGDSLTINYNGANSGPITRGTN